MKNKMRVILVGLGILCSSLAGESNPTAPNDYLKEYAGDFTDTDGDGMTDVAELRYGFDPDDSSSFPTDTYVVNGNFDPQDTDKLGSDSDTIYFKFSKFSTSNKNKTTDFLKKLIPIMYDVVGNPAETFVCEFYNRGGRFNSWVCVNSGRKMLCDETWNPRLLVHELIHVWKGKYDFTSKGSNWAYAKQLSGFEEGCEGIAYEILHDYVEAYPTDEVSLKTLKGGSWDNWSVKASHFDVSKHQEFLGGGDFWVDNVSSYDRYNASAILMQIFQKHDENFFKKMLAKFYNQIEADSNYRPNRESIMELWASVVPVINGIPTMDYLEALPILNGEKLASEFYAISLNDAKFRYGGSSKLYCAFADNNRGEFWWTSAIRHNNVESFGLPKWFGKFLADDGYYYTDNRNQPFRVDVTDVFGNHVKTITGNLDNPTHSDGSPKAFATASPTELRGNNFDIGLYTQNVQFTNYKKHTEKYQEDFYFFGYRGFDKNKKSDYSIFVGVDTPIHTNVRVTIDETEYVRSSQNGCAVFELTDVPENIAEVFQIHVTSGSLTNTYTRTLLNAGTQDGYRHQTFLIIDKDFNGVEDLYESGVVDNNGSISIDEPLSELNSSINDSNSTFVDYNSSDEFTQTDLNPETSIEPEANSTTPASEIVETPTDDYPFNFDLNASLTDTGMKISWNEKQGSAFYLELKNGESTIIYGGHASDHATFDFSEHNLTGNEILVGRFLEYQNSDFVEYVNDFVISLSDYISVEPITLQVETNNSVVIVDGVIAVEVDDSNTTIINTNDNVVLIQNTESVVEYSEENSSITEDDNVIVIVDDNVTLYTNEDDTYEMNATNSVVTVTEERITVVDDTSKVVEFGGDAPSSPPVVKSAWDTAISLGNNWYYSDWFGYFFRTSDNDWVFHEVYGWMYADWTTSFDSVWMYHSTLGWVWTNNQSFPYFYKPYESSWVYLVKGGYYAFASNTWIKFESN